jgi:hypothetical protein
VVNEQLFGNIMAFDWIEEVCSKSQDSRTLGQNLNPGLPEYDVDVVTTRPQHSIKVIIDSEAGVT